MPLLSLPYIHNYISTDSKRPVQRDVVIEALDGKDIFLQAATSFGKSLCYQLPAVIDHGSEFSRVEYDGSLSNSYSNYRHFSVIVSHGK